MEYITLNKGNVQRFGIRDSEGNDTGKFIDIDPDDIEFSFRANECQKRHKDNVDKLKQKTDEIEETCSKEGDFPTERDIARLNVIKEFLTEEEKTIDDFIGEGTTKKLLNGRKPYISMFNDIMDALVQIVPALKDTTKKIAQEVKEKYKKDKNEDNVI